jgi:hypothetical protein
MPEVLEASAQVRQALLPLDWRLQHLSVEFTCDVEGVAMVPTSQECRIEIEGPSGDGS